MFCSMKMYERFLKSTEDTKDYRHTTGHIETGYTHGK